MIEPSREYPKKHEAIHNNEGPRDDGAGLVFILIVKGKHIATQSYDWFNDKTDV